MKYPKLVAASLCAFAMPIIGHSFNRYIFIDGFPYGGTYHSTTVFGTRTFQFLLAIGTVGLILGMIAPKITIWSGPKKRQTVWIVYGALLAVAFAVRSETNYLSQRIFQDEQNSVLKSYQSLRPGLTAKDIVDRVRQIDANVNYGVSDTSPFREMAEFPYRSDQFVMVFKYPSFFPKFEVQRRLVVEMSEHPDNSSASSRRVFLIEGDRLLEANPPVSSDETKIYRGHISPGLGVNFFQSCGTNELFELKTPDQRNARASYGQLTEPTYAVFSGISSSKKGIGTDGKQVGQLEILDITRRGGRLGNIDGRLRMEKAANGMDQPWDCVYN